MPFYTYTQNNSGGFFAYDDQRGVAEYVVVEADSAEQANERAESAGLYFGGAGDCECCGNRWSTAWDDDAAPMVYGTPVEFQELVKNPVVYVHYADGRLVPGVVPGNESRRN